MDKPPISINLSSLTLMYAIVDESIKFMNRQNLNVDGEWLGAVPKLAIGKVIDGDDYSLIHCDEQWNCLCSVESRDSIEEIKKVAEKHYMGISSKWIDTNFEESAAKKIIEEEFEKSCCSFCGESQYESAEGTSLFVSEKAQICMKCVKLIHKINNEKSS